MSRSQKNHLQVVCPGGRVAHFTMTAAEPQVLVAGTETWLAGLEGQIVLVLLILCMLPLISWVIEHNHKIDRELTRNMH